MPEVEPTLPEPDSGPARVESMLEPASPSLPALPSPPSSLPARRLARPNKYVDELCNRYIESMGKAEDLKMALSRSPNARAQKFLLALVNPKANGKSVTRMAREAGIESVDLFEIFRDYYHSQGMMTMVKALPDLAHDIVGDSRSRLVCCEICSGWGQVVRDPDAEEPVKAPCPACEGSGKIRKPGDGDARKLLAETVGWTKKAGVGGMGAAVNININTGVESVIEQVERLGGASRSMAASRTVTNAIVVEAQCEPTTEGVGDSTSTAI